jgi:excisionase family DNA binding protein
MPKKEAGTVAKQYYSKAEAAKILGVCTRTVERYLYDGKLKGAHLGKSWKISSEDISDFYEAAKRETMQNIYDGKTGDGKPKSKGTGARP